MRRLVDYNWPGDIRELRSVGFHMCIEAERPHLRIDDLPDALKGSTDIVLAGPPNMAGMTMADIENLHIVDTPHMPAGNREKTARRWPSAPQRSAENSATTG